MGSNSLKGVPVTVVRKAVRKDLKVLNKKFYVDKKHQLEEKDLANLIVLEINGKVRGIVSYEPEQQSFFNASDHPLIKEIGSILARSEIARKEDNLELKRLVKKYDAEKLASVYEEKMKEVV